MEDLVKKINGFPIHPIGIGTWLLGGGTGADGSIVADYDHDDEAVKAIRFSLENGQNHIDTGQVFGNGHTEELIGKAIKGFKRSDIFISSKVWKTHIAGDRVKDGVGIILKRLNTDYLDMLSVHNPWPEVPFEETIEGINDAIDNGTVHAVGVNNFSIDQLKKAVKLSRYPIQANQVHYNVWNRSAADEEMRRFCRDNGIMLVAFKPLERGRKFGDRSYSVLEKLAKNITERQLKLH